MTAESIIKRAKKAIRSSILHPFDEKLKNLAISAIYEANNNCGRRINWKKEVFLVPHYTLVSRSWYCETSRDQWGLEIMPAWASNNKNEPDIGTAIGDDIVYTPAPKSASR
jgi:hypothetical protein